MKSLFFKLLTTEKGMSAEELNTLRENVQKGPDESKK